MPSPIPSPGHTEPQPSSDRLARGDVKMPLQGEEVECALLSMSLCVEVCGETYVHVCILFSQEAEAGDHSGENQGKEGES